MKAKLVSYKTKNQIFNDFISLVKQMLQAFDIDSWQVRQLEQVFKVNVLKPSIYISVINYPQRGSQYRKKERRGDVVIKQNLTKQEVKIRFSASRIELPTDKPDTFNSCDILELIKDFMQSSEGIKFLANLGYAQYRATEVSNRQFMDDEDNFQFLPYFDCTFVYTNSWSTEVPLLDKVIEKGIYRV